MTSRVLVANLSAPELRYLAAELARRGALLTYVARYANQGRWWERTLQRLPGAGSIYSRSLGLRWIPEGLGPEHVTEAGVLQDFAAAIVARAGWPKSVARRLGNDLHEAAVAAIGIRAADRVDEADRVVAGVGMAMPSFRMSATRGIPRILNYPSAHHRFQRKFFRMQAERQPEFAALDESGPAHAVQGEAQMDEECAMADMILTGSRFARESFISEGVDAARVKAIPYGVDVARFSPNPHSADNRFRIVYVGRISIRKGVGYLLHAYRRFHRADTDLQLVGSMIGDPACLRPYANLFTHVPHMPQSMLPQIYGAADVFVFPSLLEGLGLVVLEAMACGCPVIVSENGPGDVVRDGVDGFVVPAGDSEAIEAALLKLYVDPDLRRAMGAAARRQAEHHAWSRYSTIAADAVLAAQAGGGSDA
jgi:glycosyltransferase involved in cell wall biosynthesis